MTEADRAQLMVEYTKVSRMVLDLQFEERWVDGEKTALECEKEHLLRCSFFADMLEDME